MKTAKEMKMKPSPDQVELMQVHQKRKIRIILFVLKNICSWLIFSSTKRCYVWQSVSYLILECVSTTTKQLCLYEVLKMKFENEDANRKKELDLEDRRLKAART